MAKRSLTEEEYLQALFVSSDEEPSIVTFEAYALSALPLLMPGPSFCVQSAINLHVTRMSSTSVTSASHVILQFCSNQQCFYINQLRNSSTFKKTLVISGIWYSKVYSACYLTKCLFLQIFS
ncbi:uncharacterized protein LOC143020283 [Oratosquilla oratoria]|uniref:uncharacterized protein LOC143020283 n=1 Tax=Oratosquilla oratoria TaxID=337810 RepID=UPI003F76D47D